MCGDLHGDLFSLLEVLDRVSFPTENSPLVFAGDLIDRGVWGVELCILVFALKLHSPTCVHIARGNHETSGCAERYGFKKEVERKYDPFTYSLFMRTFQELPVAVVVRTVSPISQPLPQPEKKGRRQRVIRRKREKANETALSDDAPLHMPWARTLKTGETRVLVVHGGLFRSFEPPLSSLTLGDLATLMKHNRRMEDPYKSPIEDVLWSDPMLEHRGVRNNSLRGAGILYGSGATQKFCRRNGLVGVLRAHEGPDMRERRAGMNDMCGGYSVDIEGGVGWVATVFTAANYRTLCFCFELSST